MEEASIHNPVIALDEALLVARAKHQRDAFAPLYITYFDRVYAYCYRRLGDPEEAADATSQVFARALEAIGTCREASFRSWLFAIAHNALVDAYRGHRLERSIDDLLDLHDRGPSPEDLAIRRETTQSVTALLARLPDEQRQVLELRLAGLSSKEIGGILGKHPNAIDQAQYRAVQRLRQLTGIADPVMEGLR